MRRRQTGRPPAAALQVVLAAALLLASAAVTALAAFLMGGCVLIPLALLALIALVAALRLGSRDLGSACRWTWTVLLLAFPLAGLALYFFWGPWRRAETLRETPWPPHKDYEHTRSADYARRLEEGFPTWGREARLLLWEDWMLYKNTAVTYFPDAEEYFADVESRLERAEHFILMEYSLLSEGKLWDRIFPLLRDRAARGVEVKVLFDALHSAGRLSPSMAAAMRQCGIETVAYRPADSLTDRLRRSGRDCRSLLSIDGDWAYTGGVCLADECANIVRRLGRWKDGAVLLEGEGAWGLTRQFLHLWEQLGGRLGNEYDYYRPHGPVRGEGWCQPCGSGPEHPGDMEALVLQAVSTARHFLCLTVSGFAPEEGLLQALALAAGSGVDVRLILPGIPARKSGLLLAGAYFTPLLERGVRIYTYTPGYLHSPLLVADGEMAVVGSACMALPRFRRHHVCGVALYGMTAVEHILRDLQATLEQSREIHWDQWRRRGVLRRAAEAVLRFFAIWLT